MTELYGLLTLLVLYGTIITLLYWIQCHQIDGLVATNQRAEEELRQLREGLDQVAKHALVIMNEQQEQA